jgi:prefoldin subunit 5
MTVVGRQELLDKLAREIGALTEEIRDLARQRSDLGIRLSELRHAKERAELHRSSLLRSTNSYEGDKQYD